MKKIIKLPGADLEAKSCSDTHDCAGMRTVLENPVYDGRGVTHRVCSDLAGNEILKLVYVVGGRGRWVVHIKFCPFCGANIAERDEAKERDGDDGQIDANFSALAVQLTICSFARLR